MLMLIGTVPSHFGHHSNLSCFPSSHLKDSQPIFSVATRVFVAVGNPCTLLVQDTSPSAKAPTFFAQVMTSSAQVADRFE